MRALVHFSVVLLSKASSLLKRKSVVDILSPCIQESELPLHQLHLLGDSMWVVVVVVQGLPNFWERQYVMMFITCPVLWVSPIINSDKT